METFFHKPCKDETVVKISIKGPHRYNVYQTICFDTDDYEMEGLQTTEGRSVLHKVIFFKKKKVDYQKEPNDTRD